jgi:hypothetical protein
MCWGEYFAISIHRHQSDNNLLLLRIRNARSGAAMVRRKSQCMVCTATLARRQQLYSGERNQPAGDVAGRHF